jgi:hypothetical protein
MAYLYRFRPAAALLAGFVLFPGIQADVLVYRCADGAGNVTFSDRSCSGPGETRFRQMAAPEPGSRVVDMRAPPGTPALSPRPRTFVRDSESTDSRWCDNSKDRLEQINAELHAGYSPSRGERLRRQRRSLENKIRKRCR